MCAKDVLDRFQLEDKSHPFEPCPRVALLWRRLGRRLQILGLRAHPQASLARPPPELDAVVSAKGRDGGGRVSFSFLPLPLLLVLRADVEPPPAVAGAPGSCVGADGSACSAAESGRRLARSGGGGRACLPVVRPAAGFRAGHWRSRGAAWALSSPIPVVLQLDLAGVVVGPRLRLDRL
jgi:hypothetical protein